LSSFLALQMSLFGEGFMEFITLDNFDVHFGRCVEELTFLSPFWALRLSMLGGRANEHAQVIALTLLHLLMCGPPATTKHLTRYDYSIANTSPPRTRRRAAPAKMHTRPGVVPSRRGVLVPRRGEYASSPGQYTRSLVLSR